MDILRVNKVTSPQSSGIPVRGAGGPSGLVSGGPGPRTCLRKGGHISVL